MLSYKKKIIKKTFLLIHSIKDELLREVKAFVPSTEVLRVLLYGPVGAGKSCFVNSVQRVLSERNAMRALENSVFTGASFTKKVSDEKKGKVQRCSRGEGIWTHKDVLLRPASYNAEVFYMPVAHACIFARTTIQRNTCELLSM